jgi:hypothetical protein
MPWSNILDVQCIEKGPGFVEKASVESALQVIAGLFK